MQAQNVEEYKAIRDELARVRGCVTSYVSFVVLGSGPAFGFLAGKTSEKTSDLAMGFAAILLAIVSTLVLFLLSYKFTSHNRYAGYSKLLTHERLSSKVIDKDEDIFFWEICLDKLRASDRDKNRWQALLEYCRANKTYVPKIPDLQLLIERFSGPRPTVDKRAWIKGWPLLLWSRENSGSWKLPMYIARIFGTINLAFIVFAVIFFLRSLRYGNFRVEHYALVSLFPVLLLLWMAFISKLYRQMLGSEQVEAFCRKFAPFRIQLLRELDKDIVYALIGTSITKKDEPDPDPEKGIGHAAGK